MYWSYFINLIFIFYLFKILFEIAIWKYNNTSQIRNKKALRIKHLQGAYNIVGGASQLEIIIDESLLGKRTRKKKASDYVWWYDEEHIQSDEEKNKGHR